MKPFIILNLVIVTKPRRATKFNFSLDRFMRYDRNRFSESGMLKLENFYFHFECVAAVRN